MFILQESPWLIMEQGPGGQIAPALSDLLMGDAIPNLSAEACLCSSFLVLAAWGLAQTNQFSASPSTRSAADIEAGGGAGRGVDAVRAVHGST